MTRENMGTFSKNEVGKREEMINLSYICNDQDEVGHQMYAPDLIYKACRLNY